MKPTIKQMTALPKWARRHIELLEMRLKESNEKASRGWQEDPTEVCIERHDFSKTRKSGGPFHEYLPLRPGEKLLINEKLVIYLRNGQCTVAAHQGSIHVLPGCSNMVTIQAE